MGKQVTELDTLPSFTDTSLLPVHNGAGLKKGLLSQLANYLGTKFSNPNLLINPDFKINQRGKTSYEVAGFDYTVDRWRISSSNVAVSESGGLTIHSSGNTGSWVTQKLEKELEGIATLSVKVLSINGRISLSNPSNNLFITSPGVYSITLSNVSEFNMFLNPNTSVTFEWAKLEKGSIATPFVAPNPTEELAKCKRYASLVNLDSLMCLIIEANCYVQNYTDISMRTEPTITILSKKNDNFIVRGVNGSVTTKNLGEPTSIKSLSSGKIIQFIIPNSDNGITMTTDNGISVLLLDAEIY